MALKMLESGKRRKKKLHSRAKTYNNKIVREIGKKNIKKKTSKKTSK
jgi:hypothetical protein